MNLLITFGTTILVVAVSVAAMLVVRRRAPEGSFFADGDRASGVFGVLASGFAILLGFIVFLAFTSFDQSRTGAEVEALTLAQQVETAQHFDAATADQLTGELICYARSVTGPEWDALASGELHEGANEWGAALFQTLRTIDPQTPAEQAAYAKWLDQTSEREAARQDRIHGAVGVIPLPLWVILLTISVIIFVYMLFFADRGERALTQALLMGSVMSVIVLLLFLIQFLDNPLHPGLGGLRPVAMERTLEIVDQAMAITGVEASPPCDELGNRT